jgi:ParB-like chromosome segregation protein Spo0J
MNVVTQQYKIVPVEQLKIHPRNPRRGNQAIIAASIQHNGFFGAVVAQKSTGHILAGNHRYLAAVDAGAAKIPVIWLDVDDEAALKILLVDNRSNDLAGYDEAAQGDGRRNEGGKLPAKPRNKRQ